jgi:hypothetical protein
MSARKTRLSPETWLRPSAGRATAVNRSVVLR